MKTWKILFPFLALTFLNACSAQLKTQQITNPGLVSREDSEPGIINPDIKSPDAVLPDENDDAQCAAPANQNVLREDSPAGAEVEIEKAIDFCNMAQNYWKKNKIEKALEALDKAYSLILTLDDEKDPKLMRQKEELRFMISKRILEIYASRNRVAKGNHNAIPLDLNKHVKAEINLLLKGNFFKEAYKRSGKYRPAIVSLFKEAGLPAELSWLPLIESGFRVNALSSARALGLWQFIPSTGYKFGLRRDRYIDERLDPIKSTRAAIAYLKELHKIFGDWATVLAAYNCGEGRVLKVIRTQNINYLDNFWDLYERLPRETARYVPKFLASLHIINSLDKYGLGGLKPYSPAQYEKVKIAKQVCLKNVAKAIGVSYDTLKELNPELKYGILPNYSYSLKIPPDKTKILMATLDKIPVSKPVRGRYRQKRHYAYHKVKKGESLSIIAKRYGVSVKSIMRSNKMRRSYIVAGKILKIPVNSRYSKKRYAPSGRKFASGRSTFTYVVKSGDSLWNIARRYNTDTKTILKLNKLGTRKLSIGQKLRIPKTSHKSAQKNLAKSSLKVYLVKNGDAPSEIAKKHNMPLEKFLRVNKLTQKSKIFPGQKLYVE